MRSAGDPRRLVGAIRQAVRRIYPDLPLDQVQTLDEVVASSFGGTRVKTVLLGILAALALGLAAVGVYGLISQSAVERLREISIRMALGSERHQVVHLVDRQGMIPVAAWAWRSDCSGPMPPAVSWPVSSTRWAPPTALPTAACCSASPAVALLAAWLPARRASHADPVDALRHE